MDREKSLLRISGILKCMMGVFLWEVPYGIFLIILGIFLFLLSYQEDYKIYRYNFINLVFGILGIVDMIGSLIQFVNFDFIERKRKNQTNAPPKVVYTMSKEQKKIDLLLKVGILMVFFSGVLFATTSWEFITDSLKAICLGLFGFLFLGLSYFTEVKLKIYRSSFLYWLLSMAFFILTIVAILYFQLFGYYISYDGGGYFIAFALTYFTILGFSIITYLKYPKTVFLYLSYTMIFFIATSLLRHFEIDELIIVCIFSFVALFLSILKYPIQSLQRFQKIFSYVLFAFLIVIGNTNPIFYIITCVIHLIIFNYRIIKEKGLESIFNALLSYFTIFLLVYNLDLFGVWEDIIISLGISIYSLLILSNIISISEKFHKILMVLYTIVMGILVFANIESYMGIIIAVLSFFVLEIFHYGLFDVSKNDFVNYLEPILIFTIILSIVGCINHYVFEYDYDLSVLLGFSISSLLFVIFHKLFSSRRKIYCYSIIASNVIALLINTEYLNLIASIMIILSCLYLFVDYYLSDFKEASSKILFGLSYVLLLLSVYIPYVYSNLLDINSYIAVIIFLLLIVFIALILKNKEITKISTFFIIVPLAFLVRFVEFDSIWEDILGYFVTLYIVVLSLKYFIKVPLVQNIIYIISILLLFLDVIYVDHIYANIFIGLVGLLSLLYVFHKEQYYPIFIASIVLTIINFFHSLRELWDIVPFWFYLLVGGLFIIGFVTYKETKKKSK